MEENDKPDGSTAMERLCRELMDELLGNSVTAYRWCNGHGISVVGSTIDEVIEHARADMERRIAEADLADDLARDAVLGDLRAKADELDALREAGRVMPEGLSWPRYADGEPVRVGDVLRTRGMMHGEYRVVGVSACGMASVVAEDVEDDDNIALLDPELMDRAPKAVGADGREVKVGDTVWMDGSDVEWVVRGVVGGLADLRDSRSGDGYYNDEAGVDCSRLTHERPDSWERLRKDALKTVYAYWGCEGMLCTLCPAKIGDERPCNHYGTGTSCTDAIRLDLVARAERLAGVQGE